MEVVFLGTGAGVPAKERNVTGIALKLLEERGTVWLFDCGEATQHQILHTSIRPRKIEKIFITHLHGDHIFGLPGLLGSRSFQGGETSLEIYGPTGIKEFIEVALKVSQTHLRYDIHITEIEEGIVFEDDLFKVICAKVEHGITSYGYRIIEKDLPGALLVEKLKEEGILPGPIYQKIKQGETVVTDDGRVINGKDYLASPKKGRIAAIIGDTRFCEKSIELARDADILIHEATFSGEDGELAYDYFHSTTTQAATIASTANVKKLLLTHISSRYQGNDIMQLENEAQEVFSNSEVVGDFSSYYVERYKS